MNARHRSEVFLAFRMSGWAFLALIATLLAATEAQAQYVSTNHVREAVRGGTAHQVGHLPESQVMSLDIVLPLRDPGRAGGFPGGGL